MIHPKRVFAATLVAALGLAACGGDDDDDAVSTEPAGTEAPGTEAPGTEPAGTEPAGTEPTGTEAPGTTAAGSECAEPTPAPAIAEGANVGLAFDTGGRGDGTFNDLAGKGADQAESELGLTVDELEAAGAEDRGPNLETLGANGDNPIIAVGFAFSEHLPALAEANPDTSYAIVDGFVTDADGCFYNNVTNLSFAAEQGSFLVGAAAALKSESGHIGFIGGQQNFIIFPFEAGYIAGAKSVNPDIVIESQYLGADGDDTAWTSPDEAKEIATGWYADGVDIIYTAAGGSGQGTIEAAVEADAWAIGVDSDQGAGLPEDQAAHVLTSALKRVDVATFEVYKAALAGELAGGIKVFDLSNDGVGYATTGGFLDDIADQLDELKQQVIDGTIVVPTDPTGL